jgi:hypothetical protein
MSREDKKLKLSYSPKHFRSSAQPILECCAWDLINERLLIQQSFRFALPGPMPRLSRSRYSADCTAFMGVPRDGLYFCTAYRSGGLRSGPRYATTRTTRSYGTM